MNDFQKYGITLIQTPDGHFVVNEKGGFGIGGRTGTISPQDAQSLIAQGIPKINLDLNNAKAVAASGLDLSTSGSISIPDLISKYHANEANQRTMNQQVTDAQAFNDFIKANPNAENLPTNLDPTGQYTVKNGQLVSKAGAATQAQNEAAVAAGTMKKVPVGNGFAYVPMNSAAQQNIDNPQPPQRSIQEPPSQQPAIPQQAPQANGKSNASEIARAQQVYQNAAQLVGTPGYEGKTVQQIKDAAHNYADSIRAGKINYDQAAAAGGVTPFGGAPTRGSAGTTGSGTVQQNSIQAGLNIINSATNLSPGEKAYYSQVLQNYDGSGGYDPQKVLDAVMKTKNSTIDPYFQEQSNIVADTIQRSLGATQAARGLETQAEGANATAAIKGAQNSLEASGMSNTGEGVSQLGATSAYAQPGTAQANQSVMPLQTPSQTPQFGGQYAEGLVNQGNRLIASSSANRYQQNLTDLARQAETQLGSSASAGMVPGTTQIGGVTGSLQDQKTQALSTEFNNQSSLEANKLQAQAPLQIF